MTITSNTSPVRVRAITRINPRTPLVLDRNLDSPAPDAALDDGQFEVVILRAAGKLGLIRDLRLVYGGRHRNHPAVTIVRGRKVVVEPVGGKEAAALVDIDGESPGRIPATFDMLPGALTVRC